MRRGDVFEREMSGRGFLRINSSPEENGPKKFYLEKFGSTMSEGGGVFIYKQIQ